MGQSQQQKEYNKIVAQNAKEDRALQREMFEYTKKGTASEQRFEASAKEWDTWVKGKNYGAPPPGNILNFDLYTPAKIAEQRSRLQGITGIGAAAMSGTGDQSIALAQSRERNVNDLAQMSGAAYENAVKQQDAYFKGAAFQWSGMENQRNMGLLSSAQNSAQFFYDQQRQTNAPSFMQVFSPIIGGALGVAGSALGGYLNRG